MSSAAQGCNLQFQLCWRNYVACFAWPHLLLQYDHPVNLQLTLHCACRAVPRHVISPTWVTKLSQRPPKVWPVLPQTVRLWLRLLVFDDQHIQHRVHILLVTRPTLHPPPHAHSPEWFLLSCLPPCHLPPPRRNLSCPSRYKTCKLLCCNSVIDNGASECSASAPRMQPRQVQ
jgi:hypothetical protein